MLRILPATQTEQRLAFPNVKLAGDRGYGFSGVLRIQYRDDGTEEKAVWSGNQPSAALRADLNDALKSLRAPGRPLASLQDMRTFRKDVSSAHSFYLQQCEKLSETARVFRVDTEDRFMFLLVLDPDGKAALVVCAEYKEAKSYLDWASRLNLRDKLRLKGVPEAEIREAEDGLTIPMTPAAELAIREWCSSTWKHWERTVSVTKNGYVVHT